MQQLVLQYNYLWANYISLNLTNTDKCFCRRRETNLFVIFQTFKPRKTGEILEKFDIDPLIFICQEEFQKEELAELHVPKFRGYTQERGEALLAGQMSNSSRQD